MLHERKVFCRLAYCYERNNILNNKNNNIMTSTQEYIEISDEWNDGNLFVNIAKRLGHLNNNGLETMTEFGHRYHCDDLQDVKDLTDICTTLGINFITGTEVLT